jgi:hypothetical protein
VQFDNDRELAGWGPAARTLSRVFRLCLRCGANPVFIPRRGAAVQRRRFAVRKIAFQGAGL